MDLIQEVDPDLEVDFLARRSRDLSERGFNSRFEIEMSAVASGRESGCSRLVDPNGRVGDGEERERLLGGKIMLGADGITGLITCVLSLTYRLRLRFVLPSSSSSTRCRFLDSGEAIGELNVAHLIGLHDGVVIHSALPSLAVMCSPDTA